MYFRSPVRIGLNNYLHEGPSFLPQLIKLLLRFRCHKKGIVADVKKAFVNVEVNKNEYLRYLGVDNFDLKALLP